MRMAKLMAVLGGLAAAVAAGLGPAAAAPAATRPAAAPAGTSALADVIVGPGVIHVGRTQPGPPTTADCEKAYKVACYEPPQIRQAYDLPALYAKGVTGRGATIVIVDSFGSPTIRNDLGVFDQTFGLPAPPTFGIIQPAGKVPAYNPHNSTMVGWAGETTLDVEWAHTIAPGASILLVETPVSETEGVHGFPQIVAAEQYVLKAHLGDVISQSFSATEETFPAKAAVLALRGAYLQAAKDKVTVLAASGDSGAADVMLNGKTYYLFPVTSWPDSDPLVTGVGGTQLHFTAKGIPAAPTVWNDTYSTATNEFAEGNAGPNPLASGGGLSIFFPRPAYQNGVQSVVGGRRGVPDISMSAACNGSVDTYSTFAGAPAGWSPSCGTSEATPLFAGIVALADQVAGHPLGLINPALYQMSAAHDPGIVDVTSGNNTVSFSQGGRERTVTGFAARPGYDLASGVGTVDARYFVPDLARIAGT
ncbi:MAG: S53 family peptidase [Streptosporangiaceae bacterium]|nr:S53 family peptidase [Streptosporangiaceae bacterium]